MKIAASWLRPPGPPNIWRVIESSRKSSHGQPLRFSIQDIPEDRYDEAVEFMCEHFLKEEDTSKALKLNEDEDAVNDSRCFWQQVLRHGMSVGAFALSSSNDSAAAELAAVNILYVATRASDAELNGIVANFKSAKLKRKFSLLHGIEEKARDVRDVYGVDMYLGAMGLAVKPAFRGQRLGLRLLEARDDIGRKYGINATSTLFMGPSSQLLAERAGFVTAFSQEYDQAVDEDGRPIFPGIEAKVVKAMVKRLA